MKYSFSFLVLLFFVCAIAQSQPNWKVSKVTETGKPTLDYIYDKQGRLITVKENGRVEKTLKYDSAGRVKSIRCFLKKEINYIDTNFTFTASGKRASFNRIFPGYSTDKFSFTYDSKDRVTKRRIDKYRVRAKEGSAIPWEELNYTYNGNIVTMENKQTSFGGVIGYKYIYDFDSKGNIGSLTEEMKVETDTPKHIITGYDNHPRFQLPDAWIDNTFPQSANNPGRYQWNEKRYETFVYSYDANGLVNGYTYFYKGNDLSLTRKIKITYIK
jgi:YD repeat-containing protein